MTNFLSFSGVFSVFFGFRVEVRQHIPEKAPILSPCVTQKLISSHMVTFEENVQKNLYKFL
jgi:hypothetical protein